MKRILIVLMALLMVFACVSCNSGISEEECEKRVKEAEQKAEEKAKQQAEEAVDESAETYKEFVRYKYILKFVADACKKGLNSSTSQTDIKTTVSADSGFGSDFYEAFYGGEDVVVEVSDNDITITDGTASGTTNDATFKDIKFEAKKYKIHNRKDDSVVKDVTTTETLTITDGYYKFTVTGEEENYTVEISMGMTVDGKAYSVMYTYTQIKREIKYTNASVNGKTVTPELIISDSLDDYEDFYPYR